VNIDATTITDDKKLVDGIANRNSECENLLVLRYEPGLKRLFRRMTKDPTRAEDLTQETLILVLQKLRNAELRDPAKLTSYVYSTGRYTFLGWCRKRDNQVELMESIENVACSQPVIEQRLIDEELTDSLHQEINNLSVDRDRDILSRHYLQEQSKGEICDALVLDMELYDRIISRARQRLRDSINPVTSDLARHFA
jgi:RNA polymerase sigma-70 factor (ECF subfamily)